jgi:hypothetical protein
MFSKTLRFRYVYLIDFDGSAVLTAVVCARGHEKRQPTPILFQYLQYC